jgi:hypothetical protein
MSKRLNVDIVLKKIADLDITTDRGFSVPDGVLTTDASSVIADESVQIVVETIGGTGIAKKLVLDALNAKKCVVTANKKLLAEYGREIFDTAVQNNVDIYFGASVGGGIPIIRVLREGLAGNDIESIHGILNGTCNYILTRMENEGLPFDEVLADAQKLGYAEADQRNAHAEKREEAGERPRVDQLCHQGDQGHGEEIEAGGSGAEKVHRAVPGGKADRGCDRAEEEKVRKNVEARERTVRHRAEAFDHEGKHKNKGIKEDPARDGKPRIPEIAHLFDQHRVDRPKPDAAEHDKISHKSGFDPACIAKADEKHADERDRHAEPRAHSDTLL